MPSQRNLHTLVFIINMQYQPVLLMNCVGGCCLSKCKHAAPIDRECQIECNFRLSGVPSRRLPTDDVVISVVVLLLLAEAKGIPLPRWQIRLCAVPIIWFDCSCPRECRIFSPEKEGSDQLIPLRAITRGGKNAFDKKEREASCVERAGAMIRFPNRTIATTRRMIIPLLGGSRALRAAEGERTPHEWESK